MHRPYALIVILCLTASLCPAGATGQAGANAYGENGELYQVRAGRYDELFPQGSHGVSGVHSVLALDIVAGDGSSERLLVPGSEGAELDSEASLVFVPASGRLYLLWAGKVDPVLSRLNLVGLADEEWTEVIEVSGDPLPLKGSPRLSITRDLYGAGSEKKNRTIVHLLWWEEDAVAESVFYSPIVLLDGEYVGWNPVVLLNAFDTHDAIDPLAPSTPLFQAASIERGGDDQAVVIGLPIRRSLRLLTLEIRVLPSALLELADGARSHIVGVGAAAGSGSILSLADSARSHIVGVGATLHEGVLGYVAEQGYMEVLSEGPSFTEEDLGRIGDLLWLSIIESGASLIGNELGAERDSCSLVQFAGAETTGESVHQLQVCVVADLPAPTVGNAPTTLFVSETGTDVLAIWQQGPSKLRYRRSQANGWSTAKTANVGEAVDLESALVVLRQLVRTR